MDAEQGSKHRVPKGLIVVRVLAAILLVVMIVALVLKIDDVDPNTGITRPESSSD